VVQGHASDAALPPEDRKLFGNPQPSVLTPGTNSSPPRRALGGGRRVALLFLPARPRAMDGSLENARILPICPSAHKLAAADRLFPGQITKEVNMLRFGLVAVALTALTTPAATAQDKNPVVVIETSMGNIKVELFKDKAPITVENFLKYVEDKHYDNTVFHRVIKGFMIQGGGYSKEMEEKKTRASIKNEAGNGLSNVRGTIAMARTKNPDSATAQFFINVVNNNRLDRTPGPGNEGYAVFGQVVDGMDVVDAIRAVETGAMDVPVKQVVIKSIRLIEKAKK
jgi:cyclophilin family peptidyl-prolyl cis-trans isomerase